MADDDDDVTIIEDFDPKKKTESDQKADANEDKEESDPADIED